MRLVGKVLKNIVKWYLIVMGLAFTALIIYYWPAIDRTLIRPCHYYPKMFIDCQVKD